MRVISRWLIVSLSLLCLPLAAQPVSDLYQVREVVASQQPEERDDALKRALETLLLRLTGDPQAAQNPGLAALRAEPQQIISRYGYEAGTPQNLLVEFDPISTERTLRQAGLTLWSANRPAILAWWLNDTSDGSTLVGDAQPAATALRNAASRSGLPLRLPLADLDEQLLASAENLAASQPDALLPASARYNADALLAVQAREADGQWQAQWQLWLGDSREQGSAQGVDQQALADAVLQAVSARLAPRFMSQPGTAQALQIQVQGANLQRYAQLQSLLAPFAARLQRVTGEQLWYSVHASPEQLRAQLALAQLQEGPALTVDGDPASAVPAPVTPGLLQFHW
jgi:hypothetical protein